MEEKPKYIVAIGASAGGLEALKDFFAALPKLQHTAFIVIQHLSPDFKSLMAELLKSSTTMLVEQVVDHVEVCSNTVYLIPPSKNLMIAEGKLLLSDQERKRTGSFPIDIFFRSLAEEHLENCVAIILSGTGSDGSRGITSIKELGGLVLAQTPDDAQFDGMPTNALNTGCVDFSGTCAEIADTLSRYICGESMQAGEPLAQQNNSALNSIYKLLESVCDIDFSRYKEQTVSRRINRRLEINRHDSLESYRLQLAGDREELQLLAKEMLIGVTRFFRDDEAFTYLEEVVVPKIVNSIEENETIRVWSAGCSSGEEAISLAILFDEASQRFDKRFEVKILASDVDADAITVASNAVFPANIVSDIGEQRFHRYFKPHNDGYVLIPRVRKMIIFAVHNLMTDPPFSNCQLAVCRNVMIYFRQELQKEVLDKLQFSLKRGGYLFLGASESQSPIQNTLDVISEKLRIFRKNTNNTQVLHVNKALRSTASIRRPPSIESLISNYEKDNPSVYTSLMENILETQLAPSVLIDSEKKILHFYGHIEPYTKNPNRGKISTSINDILVDSLTIPVSTALQRAKETHSKVSYKNVPVLCSNGSSQSLYLEINCYRHSTHGPAYFLISFCEELDNAENTSHLVGKIIPADTDSFKMDDASSQRIRDLELELSNSQERLSLSIEELETTNEELQSTNEELLASNEELQSTNEELQSVNEELYSINSEYQLKIEEVSTSNSDLDTVIKNVDVGIIFLDANMIIRRFSPSATKFVNLVESDIGRPFHHLGNNLDFPSFLNEISHVIATGTPFSQEVSLHNQGAAILRITPCISDNARDGFSCVISINDISNLRSIEGSISQAYSTLRSNIAIQTAREQQAIHILIADDDPEDIFILRKQLNDIPSFNISISEASNIEDITQELCNDDHDLCFLDFRLTGQTALEVLRTLNPEDIAMPIALLSGAIPEEDRKEIWQFGVIDAINKSEANPTLLKHLIHFLMQQKALEQHLVKSLPATKIMS